MQQCFKFRTCQWIKWVYRRHLCMAPGHHVINWFCSRRHSSPYSRLAISHSIRVFQPRQRERHLYVEYVKEWFEQEILGTLGENKSKKVSFYLNIVIVGWTNITLISFGFFGSYSEYFHIVFCWKVKKLGTMKTLESIVDIFQSVKMTKIAIQVQCNLRWSIIFNLIFEHEYEFISIFYCHEKKFHATRVHIFGFSLSKIPWFEYISLVICDMKRKKTIRRKTGEMSLLLIKRKLIRNIQYILEFRRTTFSNTKFRTTKSHILRAKKTKKNESWMKL